MTYGHMAYFEPGLFAVNWIPNLHPKHHPQAQQVMLKTTGKSMENLCDAAGFGAS